MKMCYPESNEALMSDLNLNEAIVCNKKRNDPMSTSYIYIYRSSHHVIYIFSQDSRQSDDKSHNIILERVLKLMYVCVIILLHKVLLEGFKGISL